jgi:predicted permease
MLATAGAVVQGVAGAGLVAACGALLKRFGIVDNAGSAALSKMIYSLFNPAFAFFNIGRVSHAVLAEGVWVMFACVAACSLSAMLGSLLLLAWPPQPPLMRVMVIAAVCFSNVGSLVRQCRFSCPLSHCVFQPLYLAGSLGGLRKPDVYSYLTLYIAMQSLLLWGVFYPLAALYLSRNPTPEPLELQELSDEEPKAVPVPPPRLSLRSVLVLVANPVVLAVIAGTIVALITPLQQVLFVQAPLIANVAETLGNCNVGAHLLILGFGLYPFRPLPDWPLLALAACVRLLLVPSVVFVLYFLLFHPSIDLTLAWVPLTLSGTPSNLGILVVANLFGADSAPQVLLLSYLGALATVPFFNIVLLSRF